MNQKHFSYRLPYFLLAGLFGVALSLSVTALQAAPAINQSEIRSVQQNLKDNGYYNGNVDGLMGPQTREAIRKYQTAENLPVTGRVDSQTAAKLGVKGTESQNPEAKDLKQAGKSVKKGGKKFGHEMSKGKPVAAGKEFGKSVGHAAKKTGQAVKKAVSPKD
ncbi:MAG TPA: peptidoglycan-binding domain-containing protein [Terriglobia bacterium]|nr:peptidoglycan-binding domain-containing protein [Terriglobia bacterium]